MRHRLLVTLTLCLLIALPLAPALAAQPAPVAAVQTAPADDGPFYVAEFLRLQPAPLAAGSKGGEGDDQDAINWCEWGCLAAYLACVASGEFGPEVCRSVYDGCVALCRGGGQGPGGGSPL